MFHVTVIDKECDAIMLTRSLQFLPRIGEQMIIRKKVYDICNIMYDLVNGTTSYVNVDIYLIQTKQ